MASEALAECSLNTTECILETIASILSEIQEQNKEYNWDPLTFVFTAIIGVIALVVAGLAALQAFLAAGPGRTKSGVYAIGPWSQLNRRKFDLAEMRFRTTSFTPILTNKSLNYDVLTGGGSVCPDQDLARLRKGSGDYFPATWLALLTHLELDNTKLWDEVKLTGSDFIPSEFPAVPAYGSITFVTILAMILSKRFGRLTIDRESGLPTVRGVHFNLMFREHPLLGVIGFFEMYGERLSQENIDTRPTKRPETVSEEPDWHILYERLLQAHGYIKMSEPSDDVKIRITLSTGPIVDGFEDKPFMDLLMERVNRECPHRNQQPQPACLNVAEHLKCSPPGFFTNGPLHLLMAPIPKLHFYPGFFPHKKARLRDKLDTLLLQSRFWGMNSAACCEPLPSPSFTETHSKPQLANDATLWAKSEIKPDIDELKVNARAYNLCLAYLKQSPTADNEYDAVALGKQFTLGDELESIDLWLKHLEPHFLCRSLTLSIIGDGIQQMIDRGEQQSVLDATLGTKTATLRDDIGVVLLPVLNHKFRYFLEEMRKPNSFDRLYSDGWNLAEDSLRTVRHDTFEGLKNIRYLWELKALPWSDDVSGSQEGADGGQEHKSCAWKLPFATLHPLDDVLIYRAILMTLLYCLSMDSSDLVTDEAYRTIVPIM